MDPAKPSGAVWAAGRGNLAIRIASSLILIPVAIGAAYLGGLAFTMFWMIAAGCVLWEWDTLVCARDKNPVLTIGSVAIAGAALLLMRGRTVTAFALVMLGMFGVATLAPKARRVWCIIGLLYASALLIAPVLLRRDAAFGFLALMFLFMIVWLTDVVAYFCGRALGGPKLLPSVSPNKTWSGAIGGTAAGLIGGVGAAWYGGVGNLPAIGAVAMLLSAVSQAGDLFESAIKRRFHAKDASNLIPGHGGVMDRVDGFVFAAVVAAAIGMLRGGFDHAAMGLLVW